MEVVEAMDDEGPSSQSELTPSEGMCVCMVSVTSEPGPDVFIKHQILIL